MGTVPWGWGAECECEFGLEFEREDNVVVETGGLGA